MSKNLKFHATIIHARGVLSAVIDADTIEQAFMKTLERARPYESPNAITLHYLAGNIVSVASLGGLQATEQKITTRGEWRDGVPCPYCEQTFLDAHSLVFHSWREHKAELAACKQPGEVGRL